MNFASICVLLMIIGLAALAIRTIIRDKKNHKNRCGGSCNNCGIRSMCHDPGALLKAYHQDHSS